MKHTKNDDSSLNKAGKRRQWPYLTAITVCLLLVCLFLFRGGLLSGGFEAKAATGAGAAGEAEARYTVVTDLPLSFRKALKPRPVPEDWSFTILSAGDIMMHSPQTKAGRLPDGAGYDFSFMFEKIAPILQEADLVVGNLETPLAGAENGGFTGYPLFNAPEELAMNLKEAGFSLVSTANNHSLDRKYQGLCATLNHLDSAGLLHTGAFRTPEERAQILYIEVKGVKLAAIAATYGTNGLSLPAEHSYALNYIREERLLEDIRKARAEGARYVILMLHWGVEYQPKPGQEQVDMAMRLLEGGADLILGNHPHVLQRGEAIRTGEEAGEPGKTKFVMYSQGNFVSNQEGLERLCSMLLKLTIGVDGATGEPYFQEAGYIPIYTQKRNVQGVSKHRVWPLELAMAELEAGGAAFNGEDRANILKAWEHVIRSQPDLTLLTLQDTPLWEALTNQSALLTTADMIK